MSRSRAIRLALAASALCLGACVTVDESGRPVPARGLPEQPEGLEPGRLVQLVGVARDTDRNGRIDAIPVIVYVFPSDLRHASPIWVPGRLEFRLASDEGGTIDEWSFTREETDAIRAVLGAGLRGYRVVLRVDEEAGAGADEARAGELYCRFVPEDGEPVELVQPTSVIIGATGLGGQR